MAALLPDFSQLDNDQAKVFLNVPKKGAAIVTGPPGTGKTVVALYQAMRLAKMKRSVSLVMHFKVLHRFTREALDSAGNVQVLKTKQWVDSWYKEVFRRRAPYDRSAYAADYAKIIEGLRLLPDKDESNHLDIDLIIDEGQDLPPKFYEMLRIAKLKGVGPRSVLVFCDQNQTINENGSDISTISAELEVSIQGGNQFRLFKNYRNTREIAEFSRFFQSSTHLFNASELPDRVGGTKPAIIISMTDDPFLTQLGNISRSGSHKIGVIVFGRNNRVKDLYDQISAVLTNSRIPVQTYISNYKDHKDEDELDFLASPSVTVINVMSSKGLEFDKVFVFGLDSADAFGVEADRNWKQLYVTASRAKSDLFIYVRPESRGNVGDGVRIFPDPESQLCRYISRDLELDESEFQKQLSDVGYMSSRYMQLLNDDSTKRVSKKLMRLSLAERESVCKSVASAGLSTFTGVPDEFFGWLNELIQKDSESDLCELVVELGAKKIEDFLDNN